MQQLRTAGVPLLVLDEPATLDGPASKIRRVGQALGVPGRAEQLGRRVEGEIADARRVAAGVQGRPRAGFLYLRGERVQQMGGRGSGVDALLDAAGAVDIGSEAGIDEFAPVSTEMLVAARPDVLVVTTSGLASVGGVDGLVALPGVAATPAGRDRRVLVYDDQELLGGGPRTGSMLARLIADLHDDERAG